MILRFPRHFPFALSLMLALAGAAPGQGQEQESPDRLVLLDGSVVTGAVTGIDETGAVAVEGRSEPLFISGLRRIERGNAGVRTESTPDAETAISITLAGGGRIVAHQVALDGETFHIRWPYGDDIKLPIVAVRAVRFDPIKKNERFEAAAARPSDEVDQLFVKTEGDPLAVSGLIESLDAEKIVFDYEGATRTLDRDKLYGFVLAQLAPPPDREGQCLVGLKGGSSQWGEVTEDSQVWGRVKGLADGKLTLQIGQDNETTVPWDVATRLVVQSSRLAFLSDLAPVESEIEPILALRRPWQRDRSIAGNTLTLDIPDAEAWTKTTGAAAADDSRRGDTTITFEKGLGVASYSRLVFEADGAYDVFSATIGIDREVHPHGDCIFAVEVDGRRVEEQRMTGRENPRRLSVNITGARRVALIVEPGQDLDLADHADWCDACFIKAK